MIKCSQCGADVTDRDCQCHSDIINKPNHYHKGGIDVIEFAGMKFAPEELKGFCRINALKYITRYDQKNGVQDLRKVQFYINKLIELEEGK